MNSVDRMLAVCGVAMGMIALFVSSFQAWSTHDARDDYVEALRFSSKVQACLEFNERAVLYSNMLGELAAYSKVSGVPVSQMQRNNYIQNTLDARYHIDQSILKVDLVFGERRLPQANEVYAKLDQFRAKIVTMKTVQMDEYIEALQTMVPAFKAVQVQCNRLLNQGE